MLRWFQITTICQRYDNFQSYLFLSKGYLQGSYKMTSTSNNEQTYTLHYWPSIPGRGEFIRLAFESVEYPYEENNTTAPKAFPNHFAVPLLEISNPPNLQDVEGEDEKTTTKSQKTEKGQDAKSTSTTKSSNPSSIFLSQTPVILSYLAPILGLDGSSTLQDKSPESIALRRAQVLQITETALDLNNEIHDTHHPVASGEVYEDQKQEAARRSTDFRKNRLPKFFTHFQTHLDNNPSHSGWLFGDNFTIADLTLFQVIDGLLFAFPKRMESLKKQGKHELVFNLHEMVAHIHPIKLYLESDRRKEYSNGIFRHYPELDGDD